MQVVDQVIQVVRDVARYEVMPRFLRVGKTRKEDGSLFTEADLACQQVLQQRLPAILPYPVLGEEMTMAEQDALWAANQAGLWVVDPIDGTTNFVNGLPYFAVSVALMINGVSELGVIYNPVSDEMFYARRGGGAYLNGQRLPLKTVANSMGDAIAAVEIKYLRSGKLAARNGQRGAVWQPAQHGLQHAGLVLSGRRPLRHLPARRPAPVGLRRRCSDPGRSRRAHRQPQYRRLLGRHHLEALRHRCADPRAVCAVAQVGARQPVSSAC